MSFIQFGIEIAIIQICSGSVSFVASLVIVTFIALRGLDTPYRRLIFGLSLADMCQSFAILSGPWLNRSDVPQAFWGIGNEHTCRLNGFLYLVGMTAVPMYTLGLCIYYVCKLKYRMTNAEITHKVEKKMHITIIVANFGLHLSALAMDTFNSNFLGNICAPSPVPVGCVQYPEIFGECDQKSRIISDFFRVISVAILPVLSLFGIIGCIAMIFWHALMKEKIFGRSYTAGTETSAIAEATSPNRNGSLRQRNGNLQPIVSSDRSTSFQQITFARTSEGDEDGQNNHQRSHHITPVTDDCHPFDQGQNESNKEDESVTSENDSFILNFSALQLHATTQGTSDLPEDWSALNMLSGPLSSLATQNQIEDHNQRYNSHRQSQQTRESAGVDAHNANVEALSRLYKKELLTQACCYAMAFCLTTMPFLILNLMLINGMQPSKGFIRSQAILYPLAGLFNIIIYTRWNVRSWRRSHPECSWSQAFWLVVKAGGDLPNENE